MPLAFTSVNQGKIAFGFFNIYSDMLLLEEYFFFASDFCKMMETLATSREDPNVLSLECPAFTIENRADIGDLMGAIHGLRFTGFIGETYRKYPFPRHMKDFKQQPDGASARGEFERMVRKYGVSDSLSLKIHGTLGRLDLGPYQFDKSVFAQLLEYVWQGGYPRWKDDIRPDYVEDMAHAVRGNCSWAFDAVRF